MEIVKNAQVIGFIQRNALSSFLLCKLGLILGAFMAPFFIKGNEKWICTEVINRRLGMRIE